MDYAWNTDYGNYVNDGGGIDWNTILYRITDTGLQIGTQIANKELGTTVQSPGYTVIPGTSTQVSNTWIALILMLIIAFLVFRR